MACRSFGNRALVALAYTLALGACKRELRDPMPPAAAAARTESVALVELAPAQPAPQDVQTAMRAADARAGKALYEQMNCTGCHAHGGGGIGPALIDDVWIYGASPAAVHATIVEGRPNGMPAFGRRLEDREVWDLVAYVESLGKQGENL